MSDSDRIVTVLQCDECGDSFEATYDPTWETADDAAWLESCAGCGMALCDKCKKVHRGNGCEQKALEKQQRKVVERECNEFLKDWDKTGELVKFPVKLPIGRILR